MYKPTPIQWLYKAIFDQKKKNFIFGNIVPLHKSYSDVGNMGSIFSATLQPILHVPGNIIIFGTEILECTQIVGKIRNRNIIIFSAKKKIFLTMSQSEKSTEIFDFGGTLNWSKMVKMVKMVGILGAFLGEKKGEGSWVQS